MINSKFLPNENEIQQINLIQNYIRREYSFIRMTPTMYDKSIIDASYYFRKILKDNHLVDYDKISQNEKEMKKVFILTNRNIVDADASFYRPKTKQGDPRFWIYQLKKYCNKNDLIYFTVFNNKLIVIPLNQSYSTLKETLKENYQSQTLLDEGIVQEIIIKLRKIKSKGWIKSINPTGKINPRDVGDTLESALGINANNLVSADYKGQIEIKSKLKNSNTSDTLFSCVPNWNKSPITSSRDMILKFGYPCRDQEKYPNFIDLYVTVSNKINNQKLSLEPNNETKELYQLYDHNKITCIWDYDNLEERINEKHPKTAWIMAEHKVIDSENYFKYNELEITQKPILSQFMLLVSEGHLTFDWRGRVKEDGTAYKDKGHAFRLKPQYRDSLFGELKKIEM